MNLLTNPQIVSPSKPWSDMTGEERLNAIGGAQYPVGSGLFSLNTGTKLPPAVDNGENSGYSESNNESPTAAVLPNPGAPDSDPSDKVDDYLTKSAKQVLFGNYTDDVTLLGTLGQIAAGFFDFDIAGDIRDLTYDLTHWKTTPVWQTVLDAVGVIPVVGDLKYVGDVGKLGEKVLKDVDKVGDLVKDADKAADTLQDADKLDKDAQALGRAGEMEKAYQGAAGGLAGDAEKIKVTEPFNLIPTQSKTLNDKKFNALVDDIKSNGMQEPIKYVGYNGEMYVVDGHHRLLAAKKLGLPDVPVEEVTLPYKGYKTWDDLFWGD